jgi:hypothetical protein
MEQVQDKPRHYFWEHPEYGIRMIPVYYDDDPKDSERIINRMKEGGWKPIDLPLLCWRWVAYPEEFYASKKVIGE